jgi:2-polyprenyl-3-methyl-5-hydroxy-6-metoxy-1,4-benzoquinol methylase
MTESYWDEWNREWRFRDGTDDFMKAQEDVAISVARKENLKGARILDLGCGTGWLGNALLPFGQVSGVDLSSQTIEEGKRRFPEVALQSGDFMSANLTGPFDLVVSADSFAQMPDHTACTRRIAELLRPGGILLLMTMNRYVWMRRSVLRPLVGVPNADVQKWPKLAQMRAWLKPWFHIERVTSVDPGGDEGLLWWVENNRMREAAGRLIGRQRYRTILEKLRLGRELVIVARRR